MSPAAPLPVIDLGGLAERPGDPAVAAVVSQACARFGGFVATGFGAPVVASAFRQARRLFALPGEALGALASDRNNRGYTAHRSETSSGRTPDLKEAFQVGRDLPDDHPLVVAGTPLHGSNQWPRLPGFRSVVEELFAQVQEFGRLLGVPLALGLGLDEGAFSTGMDEPYASMRLHRYAGEPGHTAHEEEFGHAPHTDFGALGLVFQEEAGGLETLLPDGRWAEVPGGHDLVTVIVGELLAWWSGGRYRALPHRVPVPRHPSRYSLAAFVNPGFATVLHPLSGPAAEGQRCGDFILGAAERVRAHS